MTMKFSAKIKVTNSDFIVTELLGFAGAEEGQHVLLYIEKTGETTADVVSHLSRVLNVKRLNIGYSGLKDKNAVTYQYFSVDLAGKVIEDFDFINTDNIKVISHVKHLRKLKIGSHTGNAFNLVLRDVEGDKSILDKRLQSFSRNSIMNYFGEQRFGSNNSNIDQAIAMFKGELKVKSRNKKSMLISAARSFLFNQICIARKNPKLLEGDILQIDGSNSVFEYDSDDKLEIESRIAAQKLHISAPLYGMGGKQSKFQALDVETEVINKYPELKQGLSNSKLLRRPMTMRVQNLTWEWSGNDLSLSFILNKGSYATTVVDELLTDEN